MQYNCYTPIKISNERTMKDKNINVRVHESAKAHLVEMCKAYGQYGLQVSQSDLIIKLIEDKYDVFKNVETTSAGKE